MLLGILILLAGGFVWLSNPDLKQSQIVKIPTQIKQDSSKTESASVLYVVDGDTLKVLINNKEETVRLIGMDAPEINDSKKVQCFGQEAASKAKEILTGKTVILESDFTQGERDQYGRLLRYVFLDGLNFDKMMIGEGLAREYTFKNKVYKYQTEFIQAEQEARKNKIGLWKAC